MNGVSVFMGTEAEIVICRVSAEKNKDSQRQPTAISRQISDDSVAEPLTADASAAAEKHQQAREVD